ncbi:hypothetical protein [Sulfitobacter mediterraneus]|uniref:Uncharacterized protein n=1 Tax=Sulfitobacter mediterraneus TaxID=83219 RepID=A0A061SL47_9RHOB|nr:hypothetical protein [Sulfitobacter mediterraneus]KAJ02436.1 hypothetical protein PM02_13195 [Sulfitobacter mediterraneus]
MIDFFFAMMAAGLNSADGPGGSASAQAQSQLTAPSVVISEQSVVVGEGVQIGGATATASVPAVPAAPQVQTQAAGTGFNMAVVPAGLVADPQTPTGKFTTAAEVKPILNATKGNWVAVRDYDGNDLLYVTHLWSWRCGLAAMAISVNNEPMQNWPLPPCHTQFSTPNAILEDDGFPYLKLKQGAVHSITIQVVYDDLSMDVATFQRGDVLIP